MSSIDTLWRLHDCYGEWIRSADQKASILLATQGVLATIFVGQLFQVKFDADEPALKLFFWSATLLWAVLTLNGVLQTARALLPRLTTLQRQNSLLKRPIAKVASVLTLIGQSFGALFLEPSEIERSGVPDNENLNRAGDPLFFGTVSFATAAQLELVSRTFDGSAGDDALRIHLSAQVRTLARICWTKHSHLRYATAAFMLSVGLLLGAEGMLLASAQ